MATSTGYDIQMHAIPRHEPGAPAVVQILVRHEIKIQHRTLEGSVVTDDIFIVGRLKVLFNVPLEVVATPSRCDPYLLLQLSEIAFGPTLCEYLKRRIMRVMADAAQRYGNATGFQVNAQLKITTVELVDTQEILLRDASEAAIDGLKKEIFNGGEDHDLGICAICLEEFGAGGTEVTCMPCAHVFHHGCIVRWLERKNTCPMCRYALPD